MSEEFDDGLYEGQPAQRVGDGPANHPQPSKMDNISGVVRGPKTGKVMMVTGGAVVVVIAILFLVFASRSKQPNLPPEVKGANVGAAPGLKEQGSDALAQSQQYNDMVGRVEKERADAARAVGQSSQPLADSIAKDLVVTKPVEPPAAPPALPVEQHVAAYQPPQQQVMQGQGNGNPNDPAYQQMMTNAQQAMSSMLATRARGTQTFVMVPVQAQPAGQQQAQAAQGGGGAAAGPAVATAAGAQQLTLISAGTVESARLETGVNTDTTGSFVATLVTGKYVGARLVGSFQRSNELAVLQVRSMSLPGQGITVPVAAEVIDANTRETGTATDVDRKLMTKYVLKPLAAGVAAVGQAVANTGTTVVVNGATTVETQPTVDGRRAAQIAVGGAAQQVNSDAGALNTTPTVRVAPGAIVGIVFTSDVVYTPKSQ